MRIQMTIVERPSSTNIINGTYIKSVTSWPFEKDQPKCEFD